MQVWVIASEYPGYSIYKSRTPSEEEILKDSERVYAFLVNELFIPPQRIIIMGRSIGTGPAIHLASCREAAALITISPFTSLKDAAQALLGSVAKFLIKDRFKNLEKISAVHCSTLFIHGRKDAVVPPEHSDQLYGRSY